MTSLELTPAEANLLYVACLRQVDRDDRAIGACLKGTLGDGCREAAGRRKEAYLALAERLRPLAETSQ